VTNGRSSGRTIDLDRLDLINQENLREESRTKLTLTEAKRRLIPDPDETSRHRDGTRWRDGFGLDPGFGHDHPFLSQMKKTNLFKAGR
jgi:hypothetical protein